MKNEPKYDIEDGRIVNSFTRVPIPDDEPIFIFRAKDNHALPTLKSYLELCDNENHCDVVAQRIMDFHKWAFVNQCKEPDSEYNQ